MIILEIKIVEIQKYFQNNFKIPILMKLIFMFFCTSKTNKHRKYLKFSPNNYIINYHISNILAIYRLCRLKNFFPAENYEKLIQGSSQVIIIVIKKMLFVIPQILFMSV